ncbi:MAG: PEGA domain-containing protein [Candidatus Eremiobacteraeota bacterium]|nr:PEGA domain-containing protein [Candidatus Eremiobacteraeota bacterium]
MSQSSSPQPQGPPAAGGPPPASATPSRIEFQQLELKGGKAVPPASAGPPGVNIPPRPVNHKSAEKPPEDPSGVVPRDWPPRKVDLTEGPTGTVPVDHATAASPRFLPGPEASARGRNSGSVRPPEGARAPLGPPPDLDDSPSRGGIDTDSKASWGEGGGSNVTPAGTKLPRPKPQRAPMGKGPIILVTAFAAVLLAVVIWPPKKGPTPVAGVTESATPSQPLAATTPEASKSPVAAVLPSETPEPLFSSTPEPAETPKATPKPAALETPKPKPVVTPKPKPTPKPVAVATPKPKPAATPKPKPAETPKPVAIATPKPVVEDPPARNDQPICSVRVSVVPADVDAKVYLVNDSERYTDHSAGSVRLQQIKKGSYTLKIIANGYETFTKKMDVSKDHNLSVRLERIPPPQPAYQPPAPGPSYDPAPYNPPAPAPYYPPPAPAPSGGSYQIQAPGI